MKILGKNLFSDIADTVYPIGDSSVDEYNIEHDLFYYVRNKIWDRSIDSVGYIYNLFNSEIFR
jgi:hypothetical protein